MSSSGRGRQPRSATRSAVVWATILLATAVAGQLSAVAGPAAAATTAATTPAPAPAPVTAHAASASAAGGHTAAYGTPRPPGPAPTPDAPATSGAGDGTSLAIAQQNCQPSASSANDLQSQFNRRGPVWGGGDGAEPIAIDHGRTLWLFGDTYLGGGPYGGALDNRGFVHNSMAVQYDGSCFAYLFRGDPNNGWYSAIADPAAGDYYWPNAASYDPVSGVLSIVAMRVHTVVPNDPWGWVLTGVDVIHYRVSPDLSPISTERLFTFGDHDRAQFGTNLLADQGQVYLYGCAQSGPEQCFVARTDAAMNAGSLRYRSNNGWVTTLAAADPIGLDQPVGTQLHVARVGDGYVASNQIPLLATNAWGWWGPTATGPFSPMGELFDANDKPTGPMHSNWFTYGGRIITTSAGAIGVFSVNTSDAEGATVAGVYGPRFVSIAPHILDRNPFGYVDSATARLGAARLVGWSIDPDTTDPITVRVSIDGRPGPVLTADVSRPDVAAAFPGFGSHHGYDDEIALDPGVHQVCVTAQNRGSGRTDTVLGCTLAVPTGPASKFTPVEPVRVLDSRTGTGGYSSPWSPGQTRSLTVAGIGSVPANATTVVLNVTVTNPTLAGYVTLSPAGGIPPLASNLNVVKGQTIANLVVVQVGVGGRIDLTNRGGSADLIADVVGYTAVATGDGFTALVPNRILDSRIGVGGPTSPWGPGEIRPLTVAGIGGVPADATAVVLNVTVTNPTSASWLRASPTGTPPPLTSNLNFSAGQTIPNLVMVKVGTGGEIDLTNLSGRVDVIADLVGYTAPGTGDPLVSLAPTRVLDSRIGVGGPTRPWGPGEIRPLTVAGIGGVPANATAVVLNVTVTNPTSASWLRASPTGTPPPLTSNLNFSAGQTIPNLVMVKVGTGGKIDLTNLFGRVDVIADLVGYTVPAT